MTKQHFRLIAATIHDLRGEPACDPRTLDLVARQFAVRLRLTNSHFSTARFMEACGVPDGVIES